MVLGIQSFDSYSQVNDTVKARNLRSNRGYVHIGFRDSRKSMFDAFPMNSDDKLFTFDVPIKKKGTYFLCFFQKNWFGFHSEFFGLSNNAMGKFEPPDFSGTLFVVKTDTL